jgi:hypothetical protein
MECGFLATEYALLSLSEIDMDDVRYGQLLVLSVGLATVILGRLLYLLA